jgi:predicted sugar kinase
VIAKTYNGIYKQTLCGVELCAIVSKCGTSGVSTFCFEHGVFVIGGHSLKEKDKNLPYLNQC